MKGISEPILLESPVHQDNRGYFRRLYGTDFPGAFFEQGAKQVNISHNALKGTVRGMHFQRPPEMETKIVSCVSGRIFDVVVDIREDSPKFLSWTSYELGEADGKSLVIPEGFAHGFQTMTDETKVLYFHSHEYVGALAGRLNPFDPVLSIVWPLSVSEISEADNRAPLLARATGKEMI